MGNLVAQPQRASRRLAARSPAGTFTLDDIVRAMTRTGTRYAETTIRTQVASRMCATAPDHHARTYDDFVRVDQGVYRLKG